jgi:hypothetical protein
MERQDVAFFVAGILIVLVIALFLKPAITGESPVLNLDLSDITDESTPQPTTAPETVVPTATPVPTPTATTAIEWDGSVQDIDFVDPAIYQVDFDESMPYSASQPVSSPKDKSLVTFATITGRWSGTTEIFTIPSPSWELHYTATESVEPGSVYPRMKIQVMDADDPNRIVRLIDSGILNTLNWKDDGGSEDNTRPWTEKFYEGDRGYYLVITTHFVSSYRIDIMVSKEYAAA